MMFYYFALNKCMCGVFVYFINLTTRSCRIAYRTLDYQLRALVTNGCNEEEIIRIKEKYLSLFITSENFNEIFGWQLFLVASRTVIAALNITYNMIIYPKPMQELTVVKISATLHLILHMVSTIATSET